MGKMKDRIRAATVGKSVSYPTDEVEIEPGVVVEVRALSFGQAQDIGAKTQKIVYEDGLSRKEAIQEGKFEVKTDSKAYNLALLKACCYDPDEGERVFDDADDDDLKAQPAHDGHWLARLLSTANKLNSAGNSETTPSD